MIDQRICIVGLGLMGGSLAQALRGRAAALYAVEQHAATRQQALRDGLFDLVTDDVEAGLRHADFVVLATPVQAILQILAALPELKPEGCLVLDLGSTKQNISLAMAALPETFSALGGHPMCGKETAGYQAADPHLFHDQTFILTRNARTNPAVEAQTLLLLELIGAQALFLTPERHDKLVAAVSHLPYLLAAALMRQAAAVDDNALWPVSASGFRDTSRLAGSDPRMMLDILLTNKTAVLSELARYQTLLAKLEQLLQQGDERELAAWLAEAQQSHAAYRQAKE